MGGGTFFLSQGLHGLTEPNPTPILGDAQLCIAAAPPAEFIQYLLNQCSAQLCSTQLKLNQLYLTNFVYCCSNQAECMSNLFVETRVNLIYLIKICLINILFRYVLQNVGGINLFSYRRVLQEGAIVLEVLSLINQGFFSLEVSSLYNSGRSFFEVVGNMGCGVKGFSYLRDFTVPLPKPTRNLGDVQQHLKGRPLFFLPHLKGNVAVDFLSFFLLPFRIDPASPSPLQP